MELEQLPDKVTHAVGGLRDRAAGAAERGSIFREMASVVRRVDLAEDNLSERIDTLEDSLGGGIRAIARAESRTSWPRRFFWLLIGAGIGAAASYLGDPDRGTARRAQLSEQASTRAKETSADLQARARETSSELQQKAKMTADKVRGQVIEGAKDMLPEDVPDDPKVLEQRIKSQVFGHRDDVQDVVLLIDGPGAVAVKGTVPTATTERELLEQVAEVRGVIDVRSELSVRST